MGWGVAEDDVMTLRQMIERFSIDNLTPSPAAINFQKLDHFNGTHIRLLTTDELARRIKPGTDLQGLFSLNFQLDSRAPTIDALMAHDWKDRPLWFARGWQDQP